MNNVVLVVVKVRLGEEKCVGDIGPAMIEIKTVFVIEEESNSKSRVNPN